MKVTIRPSRRAGHPRGEYQVVPYAQSRRILARFNLLSEAMTWCRANKHRVIRKARPAGTA